VGIGGWGNSALIQAGTAVQSVNGVLSYFVWDEILPSQTTEQVRFNVNPGDSIVAKIAEVSGSTWSIYVDDLSSGQVDSQTETYSGSGSQASAEYIQEAPSVNGNVVPMDPFQPVTFLGSEINGGSAGLNSLQEVAIPGQSVPSSPNYYNDAFQVQYGGNTPAAPIPFESAMQANTNNLFTAGTAGTTNWTQGVMPGTSPSIANLPDGGYVAAFQSNNDQLLIAGTNGITNTGQGMQAGSSPSIVALPTGGYEIAFQANTDTLIAYGSAGYVSTNLGMASTTTPSIVALT
jgi:hypothetical protein